MKSCTFSFLLALSQCGTAMLAETTVQPFYHSNYELLQDVLEAINRGLDFMALSSHVINLDGMVGLRVPADQIPLYLDRYESLLKVNSTRNQYLLRTLEALQEKATKCAEDAIPKVKLDDPYYYMNVGKLVNEGVWAWNYPIRLLPDEPKEGPLQNKTPPYAVDAVTFCFHELFEKPSTNVCNISKFCDETMTEPGQIEYLITHQVIYLGLATKIGCSKQLEQLSLEYGNPNISFLMGELCVHVLEEAKLIADAGFQERYQDLFMEQILVCELLGYQNFYKKEWIRNILSWQDLSGCYTSLEYPAYARAHRRKRSDKQLEGNCSSHKTAVALGSLTTSLRFLLEAVLEDVAPETQLQ